MAKLEEKGIVSELIYDGKLLHVYRDRVILPNGSETTREYLKHPGAVCVVPVTKEGNVVMVRQFRYPFHEVMLELPAGKLDPGETPLCAAKRELGEETGVKASRIVEIGSFLPSVAYTDEIIYLYLATGLDYSSQHLDDDEFLDVETYPLEELVQMVMDGNIRDGKTQTALLKTWYYLKREREL